MINSAKNKTLHLKLKTDFDDDRPVFVSGNFCEWHPNDPNYKMEKIGSGLYQLIFENPLNQPIEYKYNKGGWDFVELDDLGNSIPNRVGTNPDQLDIVPFWRQNGYVPHFEEYMPIEELLSETFEIPQLKTTRKITVLLPHDYYKKTDKTYPVIYMNDAQNLFGNGSKYGNWEIDKRLSILTTKSKNEVIIVAINHGDEDRLTEYSPYKDTQNQKGKGMRYANFIIRTLKPEIDQKYRTKPERQFTGMGGSSMGGLISIYAGMMYPEIIGRLMVFSPALWTSPKIYFDAVEFFNPLDTKIYLYGGGKESSSMLPNIEKLKTTIENQGFDPSKIDIKAELDPEGEHNEKRWGQEFPKALDWLFYS